MIRNDIDRTVRASWTPQQFAAAMREMGYTIRVKGESGVRLKHPTVTPPGTKKNFRFDSLGQGYDLESILDRVSRNWHTERLFEAPKPVYRSYKMVRKPAKKLTGLRALYFKYCILLGTIKKKPERVKKVSWLLREDLIKLDRYIAQAKLLIDNKIETAEDLETYKGSVEERLAALEAERTACRNLLRRTTGREDGPDDEDLKAKIKHLSGELKQARKELEHCCDIADRSNQIGRTLLEFHCDRETSVHELQECNFHRQDITR